MAPLQSLSRTGSLDPPDEPVRLTFAQVKALKGPERKALLEKLGWGVEECTNIPCPPVAAGREGEDEENEESALIGGTAAAMQRMPRILKENPIKDRSVPEHTPRARRTITSNLWRGIGKKPQRTGTWNFLRAAKRVEHNVCRYEGSVVESGSCSYIQATVAPDDLVENVTFEGASHHDPFEEEQRRVSENLERERKVRLRAREDKRAELETKNTQITVQLRNLQRTSSSSSVEDDIVLSIGDRDAAARTLRRPTVSLPRAHCGENGLVRTGSYHHLKLKERQQDAKSRFVMTLDPLSRTSSFETDAVDDQADTQMASEDDCDVHEVLPVSYAECARMLQQMRLNNQFEGERGRCQETSRHGLYKERAAWKIAPLELKRSDGEHSYENDMLEALHPLWKQEEGGGLGYGEKGGGVSNLDKDGMLKLLQPLGEECVLPLNMRSIDKSQGKRSACPTPQQLLGEECVLPLNMRSIDKSHGKRSACPTPQQLLGEECVLPLNMRSIDKSQGKRSACPTPQQLLARYR